MVAGKKYQNPSGGLNKKGREYFKRTTGANLKRPSKKVGNKRRASFCARMKGMKKKLTSKKTANDQILELIKLLGLGIASAILFITITMSDIREKTKDFMKSSR